MGRPPRAGPPAPLVRPDRLRDDAGDPGPGRPPRQSPALPQLRQAVRAATRAGGPRLRGRIPPDHLPLQRLPRPARLPAHQLGPGALGRHPRTPARRGVRARTPLHLRTCQHERHQLDPDRRPARRPVGDRRLVRGPRPQGARRAEGPGDLRDRRPLPDVPRPRAARDRPARPASGLHAPDPDRRLVLPRRHLDLLWDPLRPGPDRHPLAGCDHPHRRRPDDRRLGDPRLRRGPGEGPRIIGFGSVVRICRRR